MAVVVAVAIVIAKYVLHCTAAGAAAGAIVVPAALPPYR
jgi:hypothetical protein